jgi:hypothetical protein
MSGAGATHEVEWSILLTACSRSPLPEKLNRLKGLLQSAVRWQLLFARAERHGVLPLLYRALEEFRDAVPRNEMGFLKQGYETNVRKAMLLSRELIRIVSHLSESGIQVLPYKGLALAEALYGDIALRQSGDIDLLVRPRDFARVRNALAQLDYLPQARFSVVQETAYLKSGYECVFDGPAGRNLLEVQWATLPGFYGVNFEMGSIFDRAVTVAVAGQQMKTPSPADLFLVLSMHAAKHVWGRLIWLCDIDRLMSLPEVDWNWIASAARRLGIARMLRVTMLLVSGLLSERIPFEAQRNFPEEAEALSIAEETQSHILGDVVANVESLPYFRLMLRLRERQIDRLRFLSRLVFTPGPSEWKAVRLPRPLFPLYRLVRLSRLAARMIGGT